MVELVRLEAGSGVCDRVGAYLARGNGGRRLEERALVARETFHGVARAISARVRSLQVSRFVEWTIKAALLLSPSILHAMHERRRRVASGSLAAACSSTIADGSCGRCSDSRRRRAVLCVSLRHGWGKRGVRGGRRQCPARAGEGPSRAEERGRSPRSCCAGDKVSMADGALRQASEGDERPCADRMRRWRCGPAIAPAAAFSCNRERRSRAIGKEGLKK